MSRRNVLIGLVCLTWVIYAQADDTLNRYEGDVMPLDPSTGWVIGATCEPPCSEFLENGHFVFFWPQADDIASYHYWIAKAEDAPPPLHCGSSGVFAPTIPSAQHPPGATPSSSSTTGACTCV